jgi:hypothetical protein
MKPPGRRVLNASRAKTLSARRNIQVEVNMSMTPNGISDVGMTESQLNRDPCDRRPG